MALALLVAGAWWVVRGPSMHKPMAKVPEVDLDSAERSETSNVRSAELGGSQPTSRTAETIASASSAVTASEHRGLEERPQLGGYEMRGGDIVQTQIKSAGSGWIATEARIDAALRESADPFDHAVADLVNVGDMRSPTGQLDALVQQAVSTGDARIYSLAFRACNGARLLNTENAAAPSCASLSALRWSALDPGNGVPWLAVFSQASEEGNASAQQDALAHLAMATRFDSRWHLAGATVVAHAPSAAADSGASLGLANTAEMLMARGESWDSAFFALCKSHSADDPVLSQRCILIASAIYDRTDQVSQRFRAGNLLFQLTGDSARRGAARSEITALSGRTNKHMPDEPCSAARYVMKRLLRQGQIGDLAAWREEAGMPAKP